MTITRLDPKSAASGTAQVVVVPVWCIQAAVALLGVIATVAVVIGGMVASAVGAVSDTRTDVATLRAEVTGFRQVADANWSDIKTRLTRAEATIDAAVRPLAGSRP